MTDARRGHIEIVTPEGVRFGLRLAGPVARLLAWSIDALLIGAAMSAAGEVLTLMKAVNRDWYVAIVTIAYFAVSIGYGIFFEWWWSGQTPGKRMMNLRVVDAEGLKTGFHQIAVRNLLRFVDSLPLLYLVGGTTALLSRDSQRLGDIAANTVVIRQSRFEAPDVAAISLARHNSLTDFPHLVAVLRQKASPALVELAMQAIARREELTPQAQVEVFGQLAARFRKLAALPGGELASLTDEQLVRSILQVVLTAGRVRERPDRQTPFSGSSRRSDN